MKFTLTPEDHKALPEALQGEYTEQDGSFVLNLEGHEEAFVPIGKHHLAERHRRDAQAKFEAAEKREGDLLEKLENATDKKELEEVRANAAKQLEEVKAQYAAKEAEQKAEAHRGIISAEAAKFANEKFLAPTLIQDAYAKRLKVAEIDGKNIIQVLEADGTASPKSVADLQKEFLDNKEYAPIIKAPQSSGGGATKSDHSGGSSAPKRVEFTHENSKAATEVVKAKLAEQGVDV